MVQSSCRSSLPFDQLDDGNAVPSSYVPIITLDVFQETSLNAWSSLYHNEEGHLTHPTPEGKGWIQWLPFTVPSQLCNPFQFHVFQSQVKLNGYWLYDTFSSLSRRKYCTFIGNTDFSHIDIYIYIYITLG